MGSPTFKLTEMVDLDRANSGTWVKYKETNFEVLVIHYGKQLIAQLAERNSIYAFDTTKMAERKEIDAEAFRKDYARTIIKNWRGLTIEVLRRFVPVKMDAEPPADFQFECTDEAKEMLIKHSMEFDQWLQSISSKVETFNKKKETSETKNS